MSDFSLDLPFEERLKMFTEHNNKFVDKNLLLSLGYTYGDCEIMDYAISLGADNIGNLFESSCTWACEINSSFWPMYFLEKGFIGESVSKLDSYYKEITGFDHYVNGLKQIIQKGNTDLFKTLIQNRKKHVNFEQFQALNQFCKDYNQPEMLNFLNPVASL